MSEKIYIYECPRCGYIDVSNEPVDAGSLLCHCGSEIMYVNLPEIYIKESKHNNLIQELRELRTAIDKNNFLSCDPKIENISNQLKKLLESVGGK
jgi:hypothetical protein